MIVAIAAVTALVFSIAIFAADFNSSGRSLAIELRKTGGIAGFDDQLVVYNDGTATFTSNHAASYTATLRVFDLNELKSTISSNLDSLANRVFPPKAGAADYFGYQLTFNRNGKNVTVSWVDEWAMNGTSPQQLKNLQVGLNKASQILSVESHYQNKAVAHGDAGCIGTQTCGALEMELFADKNTYKLGEEVSVFVIVRNSGTRDVNYTSPTPCHPDFRITVSSEQGGEDISFSDLPNVACVQVLEGRSLHPNQSTFLSATWNPSLDRNGTMVNASPGKYTVTGRFPLASFEAPILEVSTSIFLTA